MSKPEDYLNLMRCPVCFSRDTDVLMLREKNGTHYCVKCSFRGSESEVHGMYRDIQKKFHWMIRRITLEDQRRL
ncbi:MAG: hypothetical protein ACFUZC_04070 [Chthoniobacteraceae bacterium]